MGILTVRKRDREAQALRDALGLIKAFKRGEVRIEYVKSFLTVAVRRDLMSHAMAKSIRGRVDGIRRSGRG